MRSDTRIPDIEDFTFRTDVEVRLRDLDALGQVNAAVYLTYLELARTAYFRQLGHVVEDQPLLPGLFPFTMSDLSCRFLSSAVFEDTLFVYIKAHQVGKRDFLFDYLIVTDVGNRPVLSAQSRQIYFDHAKGCSAPVAFS